jgi:glutaconyl-CoA/methylmalonyl-CoA decarboxylase subunit delta
MMNFVFILLDSSAFEFAITVALVGFGIVLLSLSLLFILFSKLPKIINMKWDKKKKTAENVLTAKKLDEEIEGNVTAAISYALHLYFDEMHDEESNVVTIKHVRKAYSPWSSKIYSVARNWPNK